jgi:CubicO group peptidase (beta-lactamase class C family)
MRWSAIQRKLARVSKAIDKAIEKAEVPGAVVYARMPKHGEVIEHFSRHGMAVVRPERIPMARDTIFDLASLTKPIATTTATMLLVDEGAIGLDDPVSKVLPTFSERDKDGVTFRHLLSHCSGLKKSGPGRTKLSVYEGYHNPLLEKERKTGERLIGTPAAREWVIDRVLRSGLMHQPGEAAVYGDLDMIVLGAAIEAVSHQRLDDFCQERIFAPLGMKDTFFVRLGDDEPGLPPATRRRVAATENCAWRDRVLWGEVHDPNASVMGGVVGHAGLFSTVDDVMAFATTLLDVWHGRSDVWPQAQLREFTRRQDLQPDSDWALGWDTPTEGASSSGRHFSKQSIGHLGFTGTSLWIDLEKEAVIVLLTNRWHRLRSIDPRAVSRFDLRPTVHDLIMEAFAEG